MSIDKNIAKIKTKFGEMTVHFFNDSAPKHVESFILHSKSGYFDETIFHRVIPGFVIQGGDPNTKGTNKASYGTGGHSAKYYGVGDENDPSSWNLPSEFNDLKHKLGILSMARSNHPDSGGSQFFICAGDVPHLDGQYTVFGKVVDGIDVIDKIVNLPKDSNDNPLERVEMRVEIVDEEKQS